MIHAVCITTASAKCLNLHATGEKERCLKLFSRVDALRIDSWLWRTRFYKTRGLAAAAVKGGRVHVNGGRVKNSRLINVADVLQITHSRGDYQLTVVGIPERRGPVDEAESCYRIDQLLDNNTRRGNARRNAQDSGSPVKRPDKQSRRKLRALKGKL